MTPQQSAQKTTCIMQASNTRGRCIFLAPFAKIFKKRVSDLKLVCGDLVAVPGRW